MRAGRSMMTAAALSMMTGFGCGGEGGDPSIGGSEQALEACEYAVEHIEWQADARPYRVDVFETTPSHADCGPVVSEVLISSSEAEAIWFPVAERASDGSVWFPVGNLTDGDIWFPVAGRAMGDAIWFPIAEAVAAEEIWYPVAGATMEGATWAEVVGSIEETIASRR